MSSSAPRLEVSQEFRFALVMYGGVSLAIYINGVAQEFLRLVRSTAADPSDPNRLLLPDVALKGTEKVYRKAAQLIGSVANNGIYLTLLPSQYTPEAIPKLDTFPDVLPGEDPNQLTPYGPAGFQSQK